MKAYIRAISYYLPEKKLTNEELSQIFPEWTAEEIYKRTGVRERSISPLTELSSDKAVKAAEKFFQEHRIDKSEIDFLIFCTQTPDYFTPSSSCVIQERLGLSKNTGALDVNLGCTGFVYILSLAKGLIETGMAKNVLLLNSESFTNLIHPKDKSSRMLSGDAGTATLVSGREAEGISDFVFGTDGSGKDLLIIRAGAFRQPYKRDGTTYPEFSDEFGNISSDEHCYMKGTSVLSFSIETSQKLVNDLLQKLSVTPDEIDYYIFHQANGFMLKIIQKKLKIPDEKFCIDLAHYGNTISCTIPIALCNAMKSRKVKKGDKVLLGAFGVGLSWAATVMTV